MSAFDSQLGRMRSHLDDFSGRLADPEADAERLAKDVIFQLEEAVTELGAVGEELERQNRALADQQAHLASLFEMAPVPMLVTDADGVIERANPACVGFFGMSVARLVGRPVTVLIGSASHEKLIGLIHAARDLSMGRVQGELVIDEDLSIGRGAIASVVSADEPDGRVSLRWSFVELAEVGSDEPSAMGVAAELTGVIGSTLTGEETFRRVARQFRRYNDKFLEALDSMVVVVDVKSGKVRLNDAARAVIRDDGDAQGWASSSEGFAGAYRLIHGSVIADLRAGATPAPFEYTARNLQGGLRRMRWNASAVVDPEGELTQIIYSGRDITHERELEDRLATLDRLESVGLLASGLAHDFNNLLTIAVGNLELAIDTSAVDEAAVVRIESALSALDRGSDLTRRLMAMARRPAGDGSDTMTFEDRRTRVDVGSMVIDLVQMVAGAVSADIRFDVSRLMDSAIVSIDPTHLEQVLLNLITNACDAMDGRGLIAISVQPARDRDGLPAIDITVRDNGPGMDPSVVERIFNPLFSDSVAVGHAGLGLATSRLLVESAGGMITATSTPGIGTSMTVRLPAVDSEPS